MEVSSSGYFDWLHRKPSKRIIEESKLGDVLVNSFKKGRSLYGARRLKACLMQEGHSCSRKRVVRLMKHFNLKARGTKKLLSFLSKLMQSWVKLIKFCFKDL